MPAAPRPFTRLLLPNVMALALASVAGAQASSPAVGPDATPVATDGFGGLLDQLDDPSLQVRENASKQLDAMLAASRLAQPAFLDRLMEGALLERAQQPDQPLETRSRLIGALRERFMRSPRAAMGFQFGGVTPVGVIIGATFDPFPAKRLGLLQPQDIITSIEGTRLDAQLSQQGDPIRVQELVRAIILSHEPGERVRLSILRPTPVANVDGQPIDGAVADMGGQHLDILVPLGSSTALPDNRGDLGFPLENAWRVRLDRLGLAETPRPTLGSGLTLSQWVERQARPRSAYSILTIDASEQPGEFEDAMLRAEGLNGDVILAQAGANGRQVELKGGQFLIHGRAEPNVIRVNPAGMIPIEMRQLQEARLAVESLDLQIASLNDQLSKATLTPQQREVLVNRLESARAQRESHKLNVQTLTDRLRKRLGD